MVEVSICIVFRNAEATLPGLLGSFRNNLSHIKGQFEFVFVDNDSQDSSAALVQHFISERSNAILLRRRHNSLGEGRRQAVECARGRYVYFIDSDCELAEDTVQALLDNESASQPDCAATGGVQVFPGEFGQLLMFFRQSILGHLGSTQLRIPSKSESVHHLSTCSVLYKREALIKVGSFNACLKIAAEDLELSLRLREKGYKLILEPKSKVIHNHANSYLEWYRKAFRNGMWQTRLALVNTSHLKSYRFWLLPIAIVFAIIISLWSLQSLMVSIGCYLLLVLFETVRLKPKWRGPSLFFLFLTSHVVYVVSGLMGLLFLINGLIFSKKDPASTAKV